MKETSLVLTLVLSGLAAGCGAGGSPGAATDTLVFVDTDGRLVILNPSTGHRRVVASPLGRPMSLSLSLDRRQLAFGARREEETDTHLFVMDVASGASREIAPEPDQLAESQWGSGFFIHRSFESSGPSKGKSHMFVVADGANASRALPPVAWVRPSPYAPRLAYGTCADDAQDIEANPNCAMKVVLQSAAGDQTRVLASGAASYQPVAFTPDGGFLTVSPVERVSHLFRYDLDTGASVDLGLAEPSFLGGGLYESDYARLRGTRPLSPDGQEVLVRRGAKTFAVKLDGSGERLAAADASYHINDGIGFAATGDIVYEIDKVTSISFDTESVTSSLWVSKAGALSQLTPWKQSTATGGSCGVPIVSPGGHLAAWPCGDGLHLISIDDAAVVATSPITPILSAFQILNGDAQDHGFVAAIELEGTSSAFTDSELVYFASDGTRRTLGVARTFQQAPAFAYRP